MEKKQKIPSEEQIKKNIKDSSVVIGQPTWSMALPTLIQAVRGEDKDLQQRAIQQFAALCMIVDKVWHEANKDDAFAKRIEHLNILLKEEKKDGK